MRLPSTTTVPFSRTSVALHRDDAPADKSDRSLRCVGRGLEPDIDAFARRLRQLFRSPGEKSEGVREPACEELGPERPLEAAAVSGPAQVFAGVPGDAGHGKRRGLGADVDLAAGAHEGRDVGVEAFAKGHPFLVRRDPELGGVGAAEVLLQVAALERDAREHAFGLLLVVAAVETEEVDAVARGAKLRRHAVARHERGLASSRRNPVEARVHGPVRRDQASPRILAIDDLRAVGREDGLAVVAGIGGQHPLGAAPSRRDADGPRLLVVPGREDDPFAVARPGGVELEVVRLGGQPPRRSLRQISDPDMPERLVGDLIAARRHLDPAQHADRKAGGSDLDREAYRPGHLARGRDVERNQLGLLRSRRRCAGASLRPRRRSRGRRASTRCRDRRRGSPTSPACRARDRPRRGAHGPRRGP